MFKGFADFIKKQGIFGLLIGFVMGGAINKVVSSITNDLIQPLIGLIFGSREGLAAWSLGPVRIGNFLTTMIDFLILACVVYFIFMQAQKVFQKEEEKKG